MPITVEQGLRKWFHEWRTLKAWRRDLSDVVLIISPKAPITKLGHCKQFEQRVIIYSNHSFVEQLDTLVHELAHAATIGEGHSREWQAVYANAIFEITGIVIGKNVDRFEDIMDAGEEAIGLWWKSSGNELIWKLASRGI